LKKTLFSDVVPFAICRIIPSFEVLLLNGISVLQTKESLEEELGVSKENASARGHRINNTDK